MELYKSGCRELAINGVRYQADERGIVEVPDDKINSSVWAAGWVSAAGHVKALAVEIAPVLSTAQGTYETPIATPATGAVTAPKPGNAEPQLGKPLTKTD
ncbi:MAG: hypothetical protein EPN17_00990 [Methylobacter sp.]|nr:MAG: hypothetical protein EPN17_00990 [Methylobacter sp.]